ncbi:MAG: Rieske 2Fe-2S domain-containing protein [Trueperaceae bacterium]
MKSPGQFRDSDAPAPRDPGRRRLLAWLWRIPVVAALAGLGYAVFEGRRIIFGKAPAGQEPVFRALEPVTVAPLAAFAAPWDSVAFELQGLPALALRLPEPVAGGFDRGDLHLAGYSRVCTHQACTVSLNRDLEAIAFGFNYRTDAPALVCPCHLSVFSPGDAGRAVSGPATEPLPRVRLAVEADQVVALGVEDTA